MLFAASRLPDMSRDAVAAALEVALRHARDLGVEATIEGLAERIHHIDPGLPMYEFYRFGLDEPQNTVIADSERRFLLEAVRLLLEDAGTHVSRRP